MAWVIGRHPVIRYAVLTLGGILMLLSPVASLLPGPAGIMLFAGGLTLVLRNSRPAQVRFARLKRRWPRSGRLVDRAMRRRSAARRRTRDKRRAQDAAR